MGGGGEGPRERTQRAHLISFRATLSLTLRTTSHVHIVGTKRSVSL